MLIKKTCIISNIEPYKALKNARKMSQKPLKILKKSDQKNLENLKTGEENSVDSEECLLGQFI